MKIVESTGCKSLAEAKEVISSSELAIWKAHFNKEWEIHDRLSYEFGLLRQTMYETTCEKVPPLEECMAWNKIKEAPKNWDQMSWDEQDEALRACKQRGATWVRGNRNG